MEAGANLETILLRNEDNQPFTERKDFTNSGKLAPDHVSELILESLNISIEGKIPLQVSGDGNCLFNALSVCLVGTEILSSEIRVRTCLELIKNRKAYQNLSNAKELFLVSPNYEDACKAAACKGQFSSAWTMVAAATVIGCPIQSVYPPRNGILDQTVRILNTVFSPLKSKSNAKFKSKTDPILIMWTSTAFAFTGTWVTNHFVPLISTSREHILDIDSIEEFPPPLNSTKVNDSCSACPTIFDDTPILRNAEASEAEYQAQNLKRRFHHKFILQQTRSLKSRHPSL